MTNAIFGEASLGLYGRRVGHPAAPRSSLAIASNGGIDQTRISLREGLVVETEETQRARPKILDDDICRVAELQRQLIGSGHIEIDADIALAGILLRVVARHAVGRRKGKSGDVRTGRLDFDDLGTEILQGPR